MAAIVSGLRVPIACLLCVSTIVSVHRGWFSWRVPVISFEDVSRAIVSLGACTLHSSTLGVGWRRRLIRINGYFHGCIFCFLKHLIEFTHIFVD